jgi:hypothetical protein
MSTSSAALTSGVAVLAKMTVELWKSLWTGEIGCVAVGEVVVMEIGVRVRVSVATSMAVGGIVIGTGDREKRVREGNLKCGGDGTRTLWCNILLLLLLFSMFSLSSLCSKIVNESMFRVLQVMLKGVLSRGKKVFLGRLLVLLPLSDNIDNKWPLIIVLGSLSSTYLILGSQLPFWAIFPGVELFFFRTKPPPPSTLGLGSAFCHPLALDAFLAYFVNPYIDYH